LAENTVLPSFHDDYLIGYEVDCEGRRIKLHIKSAASVAEEAGVSAVVFTGVDGYHFENDVYGICFCSAGPRVFCGDLRQFRQFSKNPRVSATIRRSPTLQRRGFSRHY
jgi:hypothetical protein